MAHNGPLIRRLRQDAQMSTRDLAARAGVDPGYLNRAERGQAQPTIRWVSDVADALGVPIETLLLPDTNGDAA